MADSEKEQGLSETQNVEEKSPEATKEVQRGEIDAELDELLDSMYLLVIPVI